MTHRSWGPRRLAFELERRAHARKTVQVTFGPDTYQVAVETGITVTAACTASRDIRRHKASNFSPAATSPG